MFKKSFLAAIFMAASTIAANADQALIDKSTAIVETLRLDSNLPMILASMTVKTTTFQIVKQTCPNDAKRLMAEGLEQALETHTPIWRDAMASAFLADFGDTFVEQADLSEPAVLLKDIVENKAFRPFLENTPANMTPLMQAPVKDTIAHMFYECNALTQK